MKKLLFIVAAAALFGACEQKTEVVAPAAPPAKETPDPAKAQRLRRNAPAKPASPASSDMTTTDVPTTVTATPNP